MKDEPLPAVRRLLGLKQAGGTLLRHNASHHFDQLNRWR